MPYYPTVKNIWFIEKSGIAREDYFMYCIVEGQKVYPNCYGLEMIVAVTFQLHSARKEIFRQCVVVKTAKIDIPVILGISFQNVMLN